MRARSESGFYTGIVSVIDKKSLKNINAFARSEKVLSRRQTRARKDNGMLSIDQLNEFRETGLLVIEDVLTGEEIETARNAFHNHLKEKLGIDHSAVIDGTASPPLHRIKSPVSRIFYPGWKLLDVHMHPNVSGLAKELLCKTYGSAEDPLFAHPFAPFQDIHAYVDRICWRLPDSIRTEGGLGLHLDRNPFDPYLLQSTAR